MAKVAILPGHGGFDSGAVNNTYGTRECDGALSVALKLAELLEYNKITTVLSRHVDIACGGAKNTRDDITNQVSFGNNSGADLAVSIHFNSVADKSAHGVEVLYNTSLYNDTNRKRLSQLLLDELVNTTQLTNRGLKTPDNISVIKKIKIPVALTECAFVSNNTEHVWCSDEDKMWALAIAHAKAICNYLGVTYKGVATMKSINIVVGDKKTTGFLINGISYGPIRTIGEGLNKTVTWDGKSYTATIVK